LIPGRPVGTIRARTLSQRGERRVANIRDIAREAGVALSTVSHVLNDTRYVSPELLRSSEAVMLE